MDLEKYPTIVQKDHLSFEFVSEGENGSFGIVMEFQKAYPGLYNLVFGNWIKSGNRIDTYTKLNNNDRDKIIATVASTVVVFLKNYPGSFVMARGSTPARTRLYQMGINKSFNEISQLFVIEALIDNSWEPFKRGKNYEAFMLRSRAE